MDTTSTTSQLGRQRDLMVKGTCSECAHVVFLDRHVWRNLDGGRHYPCTDKRTRL